MSVWAYGFEPRDDRNDAPPNPDEKKRPSLGRKLATIGGIAAGVGLAAGAYKHWKGRRGVGPASAPRKSPAPKVGPTKPKTPTGGGFSGPTKVPNNLEEFKRQLNDKNTAWEL